ncbi:MAG: hypothetical protein SGJ24_06125 [Chloroflexota bacterium]|nr:hypothetical protein [Chloroflexota bacterium]
MKQRFFALRLISGIYKLLAILALVAAIGVIVIVLVDSTAFPQIDDKLPVVGFAVVAAILLPLILWGLAQLFDVLMAIEINTRATTKMLQRTGKLMDERL